MCNSPSLPSPGWRMRGLSSRKLPAKRWCTSPAPWSGPRCLRRPETGLAGGAAGLVNVSNHHAINGKTNYFDWAIFNSYVELPEGTFLRADVDLHGMGIAISLFVIALFELLEHPKDTPEIVQFSMLFLLQMLGASAQFLDTSHWNPNTWMGLHGAILPSHGLASISAH